MVLHYSITSLDLGDGLPAINLLMVRSDAGIRMIEVVEDESDAHALEIIRQREDPSNLTIIMEEKPEIDLQEIIRGRVDLSEIPLDPVGTDFQRKVWRVVSEIPRGETLAYGEVARLAGFPKAVRAVANAVGANPIAFLIPCHRVIRSDGTIGGYRWGVPLKRRLLATIK